MATSFSTSQGSSPQRNDEFPIRSSAQKDEPTRLSCVQCQKRKVKCDRQVPCGSCEQRGLTCLSAVVDPNRPRKKRFPEKELLDRIRKYEALLNSAGIDKELQPEQYTTSSTVSSSGAQRASKKARQAQSHSAASSDSGNSDAAGRFSNHAVHVAPTSPQNSAIEPHIQQLESIFETVSPLQSRIYHVPQRSEYTVQPHHAQSVGAATVASDYDGKTPSTSYGPDPPASGHAVSSAFVIHKHLDLMFPDDGSKYLNFDDHCAGEPLRYPETSPMFRLLNIYQRNIHPLVKALHMPTVHERLCDIAADPASANPQDDALFFAIFALVATTLTADETERLFNTRDRRPTLDQFRRSAQTALCRAGIWRSSHLGCLQAYFLYLLSVNKDIDPRTYAIYTGNAVRMAQRALSAHERGPRAGSGTTPSPVVSKEMATRLWWEIQMCDMRACSKAGITSNSNIATLTVPLPRNASDSDLEQLAPPLESSSQQRPHAAASPVSAQLRIPDTDCLFLLLRCELAQFQLHPPWSRQQPNHQSDHRTFRSVPSLRQHFEVRDGQTRPSSSSLASRLAALDAFESYLSDRYFNRFDAASNALIQYAHHHARTWIAMMRLLVHLNQQHVENDAEIIHCCTGQVEETVKLIAGQQYVRYQWFTYAYLPFFSFVVLLDLLRRHTRGELVDKAWRAIEESAVIWRPDLRKSKGSECGSNSSDAASNSANSVASTATTPNIYHDPSVVKDGQLKLQIRGTMLAALMTAAWEKRSQALASEAEAHHDCAPGWIPPEPKIVTAMRSIAAVHHVRPPQERSGSASGDSNPITPCLQTQTSEGSTQNVQSEAHVKHYRGTQELAGADGDNLAFTAFLDPPPGTFPSALDDMLNLNALLQSSVDLDWTAWFGQGWESAAGGEVGLAPPGQFVPSL